jgi:hypothetical protein
MKTCGYCGRENEDSAAFCLACGLSEFAEPTPPTPAIAPPPEGMAEAEIAGPEPDVSPDDEAALCPSCLFPNLPHRQWCKRCGAPISLVPGFGPFESAVAWGCAWRGAVRGRPKPIVLFGIWCFFLPGFLAAGLLFLAALFTGFLPGLLLAGVYGAIPFSMLYQVTRNYLTIPKPSLEE